MTSRFAISLLSLATLVLLTGCANAKKELGLERTAPDEFAVVKRAPLEMPPEFTLRPPEPGAPRPQEESAIVQARDAVLGTDAKAGGQAGGRAPTDAEDALLQTANAQAAPNIRSLVDTEAKNAVDKDAPVVKKLLNIGKKDTAPAKVVDPVAEARRLKANREQGKPVTTGETPSVDD